MRFTSGVRTFADKTRTPSMACAAALLVAAACGHTQPAEQSPPAAIKSDLERIVHFVEAIPRCGPADPTMSPHDVREQEIGTKVSVRGVLVHHPKWECSAKGCSETGSDGRRVRNPCCNACGTPWFIVDSADVSRPYMSRARLYLRQGGLTEPLSLTAKDCETRAINLAVPPKNVVASGIFAGPGGEGGGSYLIDDVRLCGP